MQGIVWGDLSPPKLLIALRTSARGLMVLAISAMPAAAQSVDHDRIEALFATLGDTAASDPSSGEGTALPKPLTVPDQGGVDMPDTTSAMPLTVLDVITGDQGRDRGAELFTYDVPAGRNCPKDSPSFRAAVDEIEQSKAKIDGQVEDLEEDFDSLSEVMMEARTSENLVCPDKLSGNIAALAEDIASFDAGERLAEVENLAACAQQTATRIGTAMNEIAEDAPRADLMRRSNLSRLLGEASRQDGRLTTVMISMASLRKKQLRLSEAVQDFDKECNFMKDTFYDDMTDYQ